MINVSNEFRKLMNERTDFKQYAEITLSDNTEIILTKEDFSINNNSVVDGAETSGIPLGVAVCRYIQIEIDNRDERYSKVDFIGAKIRLYLTFELSETEEKIEYGTFTVRDPETYGDTIIINALDDMYKANRAYSTNLTFPATLQAMLVDACDILNISLGSTSFFNDDFEVSAAPTDVTFRQVFGYIAQIAAGNIRIDTTGRLRVLTYDFSIIEDIQTNIDGGTYLNWTNPVSLDGGNFTDYSSGDAADGGTFNSVNNYHILTNWKDGLNIDTDDVLITGISTTKENDEGEEQELIYGVDGYVLKIENPLIVDKEQLALELIGSVMVGGRMRKFSGDLVSNPTCEFMDVAAVTDRKGNVYATILTDVHFQFFGFTTLSNSAVPAMRNSSQTYSAAIETLIAAKKLVEKEKTAREKAVEQLAQDLKTSSGLFMTEEKLSDGSIIYYMHDKPTLEESMIVWKLTALAFGVSTDGGETYPYGFTVDGETITRLLYAEGINADYITSGTIDASKIDVIKLNASNIASGSIDASKISVTNLNADNIISGTLKSKDGTASINLDSGVVSIKSNHFSWVSTYSSLSSDGKFKCSSAEITGGSININASSSSENLIILKYSTAQMLLNPLSITFDYLSNHSYLNSFGLTTDHINAYGNELTISANSTIFSSDTAFAIGHTHKIQGSLQCSGSADFTGSFEASGSVIIGGTSKMLGFFGNSGGAKRTVSNITTPSSATTSTIATKLNDLLTALRAYNLIG